MFQSVQNSGDLRYVQASQQVRKYHMQSSGEEYLILGKLVLTFSSNPVLILSSPFISVGVQWEGPLKPPTSQLQRASNNK